MSACSIWGCSRWRADLSRIQRRALTWIVNSASVPLRRASLTCDVFLEVTVGGAPLSVLRRVGQPFPVCVFLTAHAVRAAQVGQASGWRPLLRFRRDAAVGLLAAGVPQVLQVEGPGPELLPVDPLKGHDAVQVAAHLWIGEKKQCCVFKARKTKTCNLSNYSHDRANLFGFALLNPPLCVTNVQIFGVLRVQVSHNVGPPVKKKPHVHGPKTTGKKKTAGEDVGGRGLLFTVDGWVFPAGLANKNPVFHFICREGSPEHTTKQMRDNKLAYCG